MSALQKLIAFSEALPPERLAELEAEIERVLVRLQDGTVAGEVDDWDAEVTRRLHDPDRRLATEAEVRDAYAAFSRPR